MYWNFSTGNPGRQALYYVNLFATDTQGLVWNSSNAMWESWDATQQAHYVILPLEIGESGIYQIELPHVLNLPRAVYYGVARSRQVAGAAPDPTDSVLHVEMFVVPDSPNPIVEITI
jgi:hypothetical protein